MWSAGGTSGLDLGSICVLSILTRYIATVTCFIYTLDHKEQSYMFSPYSRINYPLQFSPRSCLILIVSLFHYILNSLSFCSVIAVFKQWEMAKEEQGQQDFRKGSCGRETWNKSFLSLLATCELCRLYPDISGIQNLLFVNKKISKKSYSVTVLVSRTDGFSFFAIANRMCVLLNSIC